MAQHLIIAGGGSAGWMAAALFARLRPAPDTRITLIESDAIGTIGVGEATVPILQNFNRLLGLHEPEFVAATQGSFKLGIEFVDWGQTGNRHFHGFGDHGAPIEGIAAHHHWQRLRAAGRIADPIDAWSMPAIAAAQDRFAPPEALRGEAAEYRYAYHFDAGLYARLLRGYAEARGVTRVEGRILDIDRDPETGDLRALLLEGERRLDGDVFIDCTGFASQLLGQQLGTGFVDWSHWLPANRAVALGCTRAGRFTPFTRSTAHAAGWQWRIPLQHRVGNGFVYASAHCSDAVAEALLLSNIERSALAEPRLLRFEAGRRARFWERNCVALGLASGFLEPLESTSIHLVQAGIARLLEMLPVGGGTPADIRRYNRLMATEFETIRDFLILHFHATARDDTDYWRYLRTMAIPDSLAERIAIYRASGRLYREADELFSKTSWLAVLHGQGIDPTGYDPIADGMARDEAQARLARIAEVTALAAARMPAHDDFLRGQGAMAQ